MGAEYFGASRVLNISISEPQEFWTFRSQYWWVHFRNGHAICKVIALIVSLGIKIKYIEDTSYFNCVFLA